MITWFAYGTLLLMGIIGVSFAILKHVAFEFNDDLPRQVKHSEALYPHFWEREKRFRGIQAEIKQHHRPIIEKSKKVVIVGAARDIAPMFSRTEKAWQVLTAPFTDYRIFVYENDSSDDTPRLLAQWHEKDPSRHLYQSEVKPSFLQGEPHRIKRLQRVRQRCHDVVTQQILPEFAADYVVVMDMDLIIGVYPPGWEVVVQDPQPFDVWWANGYAYSTLYGVSSTFLAPRTYFRPYDPAAYLDEKGRYHPEHPAVDAKQLTRHPCQSAFNGLGLYQPAAFQAGSYLPSTDTTQCEHVIFHQSIRDAGFTRTFIHPALLLVR